MDDLISIIIPVYNVEKYLDKCLDTVINQTYKNIEIIIVNDGSTDNSLDICNKYKNLDNRVKVFSIKNSGASQARNYALKKAKGKYLAFVDSDDYIDLDMIELLYNNMIKEKADLSCCSFYEVFKDDIKKKTEEDKVYIMNNKKTIEKSFLDEGLSVYLWNKLYKRELFKNIELPVGKSSQERFVMYEIFDKAKRVVYQSICKYYYIQRKNSTAHNLVKVNTDSIEASLNAVNYLKKYKDIRPLAVKEYLLTRLRCYKKLVYYNKKIDKRIRKNLIRELNKYNIDYSLKEKIEIILLKYFPHIYKIIGKIYYNRKYRKMT